MKRYALLASALCISLLLSADRAKSQTGITNKQAIDALVIVNRALASEELGVLDTAGHVSVRSPTNPNHFFLARWIAPGMVTARDIIEYDLEGNPVAGERKDQYLEKWIHSEIYKARPDVNAVVHGHTPEVIAFAASSVPLSTYDRTEDAFISRGLPKWDVRKYTGRPGIVETKALGKSMAETLGNKPAMFLVGHGFVATSNSIYSMIGAAEGLKGSAKLMLNVIAIGQKLNIKPPRENQRANAAPPVVPTGDGGGKGGDRSWGYWQIYAEKELASEAKAKLPTGDPAKTRADLILDLSRINRLLASPRLGILGTAGHVSVRNPDNPNTFFLARYVSAGRVFPSDIVEYDFEGNPVGSNRKDSYQERFIHAELYRSRKDVNSVLHAHTQELVAYGLSDVRLRPMSNGGTWIPEAIPMFDIRKYRAGNENIISTAPLGKALAQVIGDKPMALLPGHGIVVVAPTLYGIMGRAMSLRETAIIQQMAIQLGGDITYWDAPIAADAPARERRPTGEGGGRGWNYWVRQVGLN